MYGLFRAMVVFLVAIFTALAGCSKGTSAPDAGPDAVYDADSGTQDIDADGGTTQQDSDDGGDDLGDNRDAGNDGGDGTDGDGTDFDTEYDIARLKFAGPDILFVIDNTTGVVAEQLQLARAFPALATELEPEFGPASFHAAVVTTGMESGGCPLCRPDYPVACINQTGESGRFQDLVGHNSGTEENPSFEFTPDPACRVVSAPNTICLYDEAGERGTALVGATGCGYERGLAAMRRALQPDFLASHNSGFLRQEAPLVIVFLSDEEDCGEPGDVTEGILGVGGNICYFASRGMGPDGEQVHPDDPNQRPYRLTPEWEYYLFLADLKNDQWDKIFVAVIVGIEDVYNPYLTDIEYQINPNTGRWEIVDACVTPGCSGSFCNAKPGTRYLKLANLFQQHGLAETICQSNFRDTMRRIGRMPRCPRQIPLLRDIHDNVPNTIFIDGVEVPRYTCSIAGTVETCSGPDDLSCSAGSCRETWGYQAPTQEMPLGSIRFAAHYSPCLLAGDGEMNISMP